MYLFVLSQCFWLRPFLCFGLSGGVVQHYADAAATQLEINEMKVGSTT